MNEQSDNSSLPILLTISAAVLVTAAGGWFLLDDDFSEPVSNTAPAGDAQLPVDTAAATAPDSTSSEDLQSQELDIDGDLAEAGEPRILLSDLPLDGSVEAVVTELALVEPAGVEMELQSKETNLRKARLAAEADMLAYPVDQSAMYYYNQILAIDPEHEVAKAELEATLGRLAQTAAQHLDVKEYEEAYELAVLVSSENPGHALVQDVTRELDRMTNGFVEVALQNAQEGNDEQVELALAAAQALPGRNPEYFTAVRDSIENISSSRIADEQTRLEQVRLAAVQASNEWTEKVRGAIVAGRLVTPAGENALAYLAERDSPDAEKEELQEELTSAILSECAARIDGGSFAEAERLLAAASDFLGDNEATESLRNSLDTGLIEAESAKILNVEDFVRLAVEPPRYPRRARERDIEGWVEVNFVVTATGTTADIEVQNSEPGTIFHDAAVSAVENWTFQPRVFRGQAINQRANTRLVFKFE
ncbi:MAG: energy transducer TonB [Woeseiaceae bacterium]